METLLLGTYTRQISKGIYRAILDPSQKKIINVECIIEEQNPTYLALAHHHLFSVSKVGATGGIANFERHNNGYELVNRVLEPGSPLCYISCDLERKLVFGANYHEGMIYSYLLEENGELSLADCIERHGSGPHANQQSSHIHFTHLTPDNRLVVCDLGTDEVLTYDISPVGKLTEVATCHLTPGAGPRHLVFNPSGTLAYVLGELDNRVYVLEYDKTTGQFTMRADSYSIMPNEVQTNGGAAIRLTHDGRFLYTSNRANNTITVFKVENNGYLSFVQQVNTEGVGPRDFNFNRSEDFIIVGHQHSNQLTLFQRNKETGELTLCQKDCFAPEVVCVIPNE